MKKLHIRLVALLILVSSIGSPILAATTVEPVVPVTNTTSEPGPESVRSALKDFKALPRKERKSRLKEAKKMFKEYRADKRAGKAAETDTVLLAILAILLPPLAVYLKEGEVNNKFWLSLILTLLFWIPGVVYALLVVFDAV